MRSVIARSTNKAEDEVENLIDEGFNEEEVALQPATLPVNPESDEGEEVCITYVQEHVFMHICVYFSSLHVIQLYNHNYMLTQEESSEAGGR